MPNLPRISLLAAFALLTTISCYLTPTSNDRDTRLVVFAASSLTESFKDAAAAFEAENPTVKVVLNFDGSQRLSTQLTHGARADLFASADWRQMETIVESGLVQGQPISFTANRLAMIASTLTQESPAESATLEYLAQPGTKVVLAQENVPVGGYTREVLKRLEADPILGPGYSNRVLANLVSEESNVRYVAQKVASGEADAGIVYQTDALAPDIRNRVLVVAIPESMNISASYPIAIMRGSEQQDLARRFIEFLLSDDGEKSMQRYGFGSVHRANLAENAPAAPSSDSR